MEGSPRVDCGRRHLGEATLWEKTAYTLEFALAQSQQKLEEAYTLTHAEYVRQKYMVPHPSGMRVSIHYKLPTTKTFVAYLDQRLVGTISLIPDSSLGLPMEETYPEEIYHLRHARQSLPFLSPVGFVDHPLSTEPFLAGPPYSPPGHQPLALHASPGKVGLAEVSSLATNPACRHLGWKVLMGLYRALFSYARGQDSIDYLCIAVNPRHVSFYKNVLLFESLGEQRPYAQVNHAPSVALFMNLSTIEVKSQQIYGHTRRDLHCFFFGDGYGWRIPHGQD